MSPTASKTVWHSTEPRVVVEHDYPDDAGDHGPVLELRIVMDVDCPGCDFPEIGYAPSRDEYCCSRCGWASAERPGLRRCVGCGCTDDQACDPPCSWVEEDRCSACPPSASVVRDLLSLVDDEFPIGLPTVEAIESWPAQVRNDAAEWAAAVHLYASDNHDVEIPAMPGVLEAGEPPC